MTEKFDWRKYANDEITRMETEIGRTESKAACPNHSGDATVEAFTKAAESIVGIFAEKTKGRKFMVTYQKK